MTPGSSATGRLPENVMHFARLLRPAGVRAMLPHVDLFLPVHNLKSLVDLAKTLSRPLNKETPQWK